MRKRVAIVILNYNNFQDTINCIDSLIKNENENYRLIIVDNASTNNSVAEIEIYLSKNDIKFQCYPNHQNLLINSKFIIIKLEQNIGYARGNNIGLNLAVDLGSTYLVVLNNDTMITQPFLAELKTRLENDKNIGIISPLLKQKDGSIDRNVARKNPSTLQIIINNSFLRNFKLFQNYLDRQYCIKSKEDIVKKEVLYPDLISGSCIMMKSVIYKKIDGFDKNTFLYFEENIVFEKLKQLDLTSCVYLNKHIIHLGAESTRKINSVKLLEYQKESLIYYLRKYRKSILGVFVFIILHEIRKILLRVKFK